MEGINRLKKLAEGQEDSALLQVVDYLCSRIDLGSKIQATANSFIERLEFVFSKGMEASA